MFYSGRFGIITHSIINYVKFVGRKNYKENIFFKDYYKLKVLMVPSITLVILKFCRTKNLFLYSNNTLT